ncbi:MAG TPA: arsenate reductase ArsC [Sedimentisphaerales bacterium]|nr:arsenate reductase ArsC [Sedimentisphaerales bacterium]
MTQPKQKIKVLFLCTGNACRSQMAEGWAKHLKSHVIDAYSAGIMPSAVNAIAIQIMAEAGVDISSHFSKHIDDLTGINFDYVVTLCDNARQQCPVFHGRAKLVHEPFIDPSFVPGTRETVLAAFRTTRDKIREFIEKMPHCLYDHKS